MNENQNNETTYNKLITENPNNETTYTKLIMESPNNEVVDNNVIILLEQYEDKHSDESMT